MKTSSEGAKDYTEIKRCSMFKCSWLALLQLHHISKSFSHNKATVSCVTWSNFIALFIPLESILDIRMFPINYSSNKAFGDLFTRFPETEMAPLPI